MARIPVAQAMLEYVRDNPGCTTKEFAKAHFGPDAVQPRVNGAARLLESQGKIERRKDGGPAFRLYLTNGAVLEASVVQGVGLAELLALDFEHAGWWEMEAGKAKCRLYRHAGETCALYAFIVGRNVMYVGKTSRAVRDRMRNYEQTNSSGSTTMRCNSNIAAELGAGRPVDVYVLPDREAKDYRGHKVNLSDGLEPNLIRHFRPPWNGRM